MGASTAAHQIEGNNVNSDWWQTEHSGGFVAEPSGDAADSYHRWREDMDLLAELGFTAYRFSIEWARIEPAPGHFSKAEIAHYRRMVEGAIERGLRPMVTLHHFTVPRWFAERGGWTADGAVDLFERYVRATAPVIGTGVRHVCTINEPNMIAVAGAVRELGTEAPPAAGLPLPDKATTDALIQAHHRATAAVKAISADIQVGWSIANQVYQALPGAEAATAAYSHPAKTSSSKPPATTTGSASSPTPAPGSPPTVPSRGPRTPNAPSPAGSTTRKPSDTPCATPPGSSATYP